MTVLVHRSLLGFCALFALMMQSGCRHWHADETRQAMPLYVPLDAYKNPDFYPTKFNGNQSATPDPNGEFPRYREGGARWDSSGRQDDPEAAWRWFYTHRMDPMGYVPVDYRERSLEEARRLAGPRLQAATANWTYIGPGQNTSVLPNGRIVDMAVHPTNDQIVYVATAGGGVWKTTNAGNSWTNLTDNKIPTLGIGSIVMAPSDANHLLIGLGEGAVGDRNDIDPLGTGIYRTTNGGTSWSLLPGTGNGVMQFVADVRFVGNTNVIMAAAAGGYQFAGKGIFRSTDGGQTWTKVIDKIGVCISVDPTNAQKVVVSTWEVVASQQGNFAVTSIHYSTNGGQSFTQATYPEGTNGMNAELARDKANPNIMLALISNVNREIHGIWRSTNGGLNWTATGMAGIPTGDPNYKPSQMNYNNCIALNGSNAYFGSNLRAYKSTNGGTNWTAMTDWDPDDGDGLPYIHADHHSIAFGSNTNTIYMGTDGGFFVSTNGGAAWTERNKGLDTTQIYRISSHPTRELPLMMGCQDNDKYLRKPDGSWHHWPNTFGDAMEVEVIPGDPEGDGFMGCNYGGASMAFTPNGGANWYYFRTQNNGIPPNERGSWVIPFALDPKNPTYLWTFLQNLYRMPFDPNQVTNFQRMVEVDPQLAPAGSFELLAFSWGDNDRQIYAGLNRVNTAERKFAPSVMRANIGSGTGAIQGTPEFLAPPRGGVIGAIACDPKVNDTVWLSYTDYGQDKGESGFGRIYRSTNRGNTWENRTGNFPTNLPVGAIFIDPTNSNVVIVGTDLGCYRTDNAGGSWYAYNQGLPNTVVSDFSFYAPTRKLRAGTFGRGIWETNIDTAAQVNISVAPESLTFNVGASEPMMPAAAEPLVASKSLIAPAIKAVAPPPPAIPPKYAPAVSLQGDVTLLNDSFERTSLGASWTPGQFQDPTWGIDDTRHNTGSRAIWCARDGFFGVDPAASTYPPGTETYVDYGPFSLQGATAGNVSFWYDMDIDIFDEEQLTGDIFYFEVIVYDPFFNQYYFGYYYGSGRASDTFTVDFADVAGLGNVLGQQYVWIRFYFLSDWWTQAKPSEPQKAGVWVDDVLIRITDNTTPVAAPTGVAATTNLTDKVQVQWGSVSGANAYQVCRSEAVNNSSNAAAVSDWIAATTYDDANVGSGKNYYYFVKARNDFVTSPFSSGVLGKLADPVPLAAPTGVVATQNIWNRVGVSWNAVPNATEYQLRRFTGSNNQAQSQPVSGWQTARTFNDTQVIPGTNYYYYVQARNAQSQSPISAGVPGRLLAAGVQDKTFKITNTGDGTLSIDAIAKQNNSAWLQVFPPGSFPVRLDPGQNATFYVRTNPAGLTAVSYTDRLIITNNTPGKSPYPTGVNVTFFPKNAVQSETWKGYD